MKRSYEQLRKKVNSIIHPDGVPLGFGCEVMVKDCEDAEFCSLDMSDTYLVTLAGNGYVALYGKRNPVMRPDQRSDQMMFDPVDIENLGPALSLQDILRAMDIDKYDFDLEGHISSYEKSPGCGCCGDYVTILKLDLSKQPKDRPEETLQKILDLLS